LIKDNLEKDIVADKSKFIVKKNKVIIKLQKVKGEYSYEHWAHLTAKKGRDSTSSAKKDPSASIMDMMKDM
jgi:calcyclin binding protein